MANSDAARIERQIELILESPEFARSRRLTAFFKFVCQAALEGHTEVDQVDIARVVLGLDDFNPVEDAAVRKLAAITRQRLAQYYESGGKHEAVAISLPVGSYLPRFRFTAEPDPDQVSPSKRWSQRINRRFAIRSALVALALLAGALAIYSLVGRRAERSVPGQVVLMCQKGSIHAGQKDAPPDSLLVGPVVGTTDQIVARMVFSPRARNDQAGIMVFENADNYVKLARILRRHNNYHFAHESSGIPYGNPETYHTDLDGQTGAPVWLAIRRKGQEFRAFVSHDGRAWERVGGVVAATLSPGKARFAIFGFREADGDSKLAAAFDQMSVGPPLASWGDDVTPPSALDGWEESAQCEMKPAVAARADRLEVSFAEGNQRCRWHLTRPVPAGDWAMRAVVHNSSWGRVFAGVGAIGPKATVQVTRSDLIIGEANTGVKFFQRPDFPGSPPLHLRLYSTGGVLHVALSANGETWQPQPLNFDLRLLGGSPRFGPMFVKSAYQKDVPMTTVGLQFVGMDVLSLEKYR